MKLTDINSHDYKFTFETNSGLYAAEKEGSMEYDIVRIDVEYDNGYRVDYPVHTRQELAGDLSLIKMRGGKIHSIYECKHYHDIFDNMLDYMD